MLYNYIMKKIILILCLLLAGCGREKSPVQPEPVSASVSVLYDQEKTMLLPMNTSVLLTMYDPQQLDQAMPDFEALIHQLHQLFDPDHGFTSINNLYVINQHYGSEDKLLLDPLLFDALKDAIALSVLSEGSFNPTIGALSDLYQNKYSSLPIHAEDPADEDINAALACVVPYDQLDAIIQLDETDHSVIFNTYSPCEQKVKLNLGAFAKGIAAQKAYETLKHLNVPFMAACSESSQFLYAPTKINKTWTWGIREPNAKTLLAAYEQSDIAALSTSGDDQQYYYCEKHQINHHHILDPTMGRSRNMIRSVSVFSDNRADILDALTTILFNIEDAKQRITLINQIETIYEIKIGYTVVTGSQEDGYQLTMNQTAKDALAYQGDAVNAIIVED